MTDLEDLNELMLYGDAMTLLASHPVSRLSGLRAGGPIDHERIENAVRDILIAIGEDPDRDGLADTPARVARSYAELFRGLHESPQTHLGRVFQQEHDDAIIVRDIEFYSVCEHHLLPFFGKAHVAYVPSGGQVVGLSKLARTVDVFARRPQVQERLTNQIADAIDEYLNPRGIAVVIEAEHLCMKMRGVKNSGSAMLTSTLRGILREDRAQGAELLNIMLATKR